MTHCEGVKVAKNFSVVGSIIEIAEIALDPVRWFMYSLASSSAILGSEVRHSSLVNLVHTTPCNFALPWPA